MHLDGFLTRTIIFLLLTLSCPVLVAATPVPRETLERLAEINVQIAESRQLNSIGKLSNEDYTSRAAAIEKERQALWFPYDRVTSPTTPEERQAAMSTIDGLSKMKLSLLEPRWKKEQEAFREAGRHREEQTGIAVEQDARHAAQLQKQRLLLQGQLDRGEITRDIFTTKDREAETSVMNLRKKSEDAGGGWSRRFDDRLAYFTKEQAESPHSRTSATSEGKKAGRGGGPDFDSDVKRAAEVLVKHEEMRWKLHKDGPSAVPGAAIRKYSNEFSELRARYLALHKLEVFEAAYTPLAEPGLQALRAKYQPEKYQPPPVASNPAPVQTDYSLWYWIGGGIIVLLIIGWATSDEEQPQAPRKPDTSGIYGTADWAEYEQYPAGHSNVSRGVTFGKSSLPGLDPDAPGAPITSQPESHSIIFGQTGSGKGTRVIIPTLLRYSSSMMIVDCKGENAAVTARARRDHLKQEVQIINPWGVLKDHYSALGFQTATFNPLDLLTKDDPNAVSIAHTLASTICPITDPKQAFWQGSAANILAGVMLWLTDHPLEENTLARIREIVTLPPKEFRKIIAQMLACDAFGGAVKEAVGQASDPSAADTYGGIMYNLQQTTAFISDTQIKTSTSASSFSMQKLSTGRLTLYLVIPFKLIKTHSTWFRLVIASGMQAMIASRESPTGKTLHRCMFMIDEFGSIGQMPDVASQLAQMRSYGMDFTLILQGLNQLKEHYGDARDSILGHCKYKYFCSVNDLESAKYLSETLGKKTVQTVGKSTSTGSTQAGQTEGTSTTLGETGRSLFTPDEIMLLGKNTAILLTPDTRPHYLHPVDYWKLTSAYEHLSGSHSHLYWNPSVTYDQNPAVENSQKLELTPMSPDDVRKMFQKFSDDMKRQG